MMDPLSTFTCPDPAVGVRLEQILLFMRVYLKFTKLLSTVLYNLDNTHFRLYFNFAVIKVLLFLILLERPI